MAFKARGEMKIDGFKDMLVANSIFIAGKLMPVRVHGLQDAEEWDTLEKSCKVFERMCPSTPLVGLSQMFALN